MQQDVIRLVGPGGAGKTTTGACLAQRLGLAFGVYRDLPATKLETMTPLADVVDAAVANLLPNNRLQPSAAGAIMGRF
jgi:adenylate kinase family enzyme